MIDTEERFKALIPRLEAAEWIAMDTEADSLHAYPEKLCLLQLSIPDADDLIDPLAGLDLIPLLAVLSRKELIFHGADYDLRMLRRAYGFVPESIFDTMEAARLLGHREFGLTHLVQKHLGVTLEKGPQKANWASRPLTKRMHIYALNDTRYLKPLADLLRAALLDKGRLGWHEETCARLVASSGQFREIDPDQVWRLSGSHRLDRVGLAILRELWRWREQQAIRANRPPYFVLSHEMLLSLALDSSRSRTPVNALPRSVPLHYEPGLLAAINTALALPAEARPAIYRSVGRQRSETERRRLEAIKKRRDVRASELSIDPTLIASRATLELLAENNEKHQEQLMGWQRDVLR